MIFYIDFDDLAGKENGFCLTQKLALDCLGRQIESGNWQLAEKALNKANQLCIEDPRILAAKGWAEFNNPDKDEINRRKEGT